MTTQLNQSENEELVSTTVRVSKQVLNVIKAIAKRDKRSQTATIAIALETFVENEGKGAR